MSYDTDSMVGLSLSILFKRIPLVSVKIKIYNFIVDDTDSISWYGWFILVW